jgi:protein required for attachment to host cells
MTFNKNELNIEKRSTLMKKESWLVVANSSIARIYKIEKKHDLFEIKVLEHPESRLHNLDLVSDKPGRDFESAGIGKHSLEPKTLPKRQEFALFAKSIADYLENARNQGEFDTLYVAANPSLLGLLRQSLHPNTAKLLKGEVDKDLTLLKPRDIPTHLPFLY